MAACSSMSSILRAIGLQPALVGVATALSGIHRSLSLAAFRNASSVLSERFARTYSSSGNASALIASFASALNSVLVATEPPSSRSPIDRENASGVSEAQ